MTTRKKEAIIVTVCALVSTAVCFVLDFLGYDWGIEVAFFTLIIPFIVYGVILDYRKEKPIYDRARRIKALREQNR